MSLLFMLIDGAFAGLLAVIVAMLSFNAWLERRDGQSCAVGFAMAALLALIALRLVFK